MTPWLVVALTALALGVALATIVTLLAWLLTGRD